MTQQTHAKVASSTPLALPNGKIATNHLEKYINEEVAKSSEIDFSHVQFEPLDVPDAAGVSHRLHFEVRLLGDKVSLQAFELIDGEPGGHEFQVLGDADGDGKEISWDEFGRMVMSFEGWQFRFEIRDSSEEI